MADSRDLLIQILNQGRLDRLPDLADRHPDLVRKLYALLFNRDELLGWRAVLGLGELAAHRPGKVRRTISRLAWSINDEASTCGRLNPAALGEITARNPELTREVVRIVVHYFEDPETCHGSHRNVEVLCSSLWAIGRIGQPLPHLVEEVLPTLIRFLADPLPQVRACAAWAMGRAGMGRTALPDPLVSTLLQDSARVAIFDPDVGDRVSRSVAQWAAWTRE